MGGVKPIGGVSAKILAAKNAGAKRVIIPIENWNDKFKNIKDVEIIPVKTLKEVINIAIQTNIHSEEKIDVLSAKAES